jgi:hypothetical protein
MNDVPVVLTSTLTPGSDYSCAQTLTVDTAWYNLLNNRDRYFHRRP